MQSNFDPEKYTKPFKLCYKNEIHRISKLPIDYKALLQHVFLAFKSDLPSKWALQYEDADGDRVMLSSDDDYKAMLECEHDSPAKSIKIFLLPLDDNASMDLSASEILLGGIQKAKSIEYSVDPIAERQEVDLDEEKEKIPVEEKPDPVEPKEAEIEEDRAPLVEEAREMEAERPAEEVQEEPREEIQPKVEEEKEEETDEVHDLVENDESSSQMDDAIDTHDDDQVKPKEKPEKRKIRCKREKKDSSSESPVKDQVRINLRKEQKKKEQMRSIVTDIMFENAPQLAEIIREYLNNPSAFNLEEIRKKTKPQQEDKTVHDGVTCDGCGMKPIVGTRFKCSVCDDFDYCARCESTIEHPHHFLKIKGKIGHAEEKKEKKPKRHLTEKSVEAQKERAQEPKPEKPVQREEKIEEVKIEEPKPVEKPVEKPVRRVEDMFKKEVEPKEDPIGVTMVKEIQCIPMKIRVADKSIYKSVCVRNSGKVQWPKNAVLRNTAGVGGQDTKLIDLIPGKEMTAMFILQTPSQPGQYTSTWQLTYVDDNGDLQFAGEPLSFGLIVLEDEPSQVIKKEGDKPKQPVVEPKPVPVVEPKPVPIVEPKPVPVVEPKKEVPSKKEYPEKVKESARLIKEFFPDADYDALLEFVTVNPKLTNDELVNKFLEQQ